MRLSCHVLPLLLAACLLHVTPVHADTHHEAARVEAWWTVGRRFQTKSHVTCTLEIAEPLEYFTVNLTTASVITMVETWSLDVVAETQSSFLYHSKRTMYPPRIVLNFHVTTFGINQVEDPLCIWDVEAVRLVPQIFPSRDLNAPQFGFGGRRKRNSPPAPRPPVLPSSILESCKLLDQFLSKSPPPLLVDPTMPPPPSISTEALPQVDPLNQNLPPRLPGFLGPGGLPPPSLMPEPLSPYQLVVQKSMYFYAAQRSGHIDTEDSSAPYSWVQSSGTNHVAPDGTNLVGGWYNGDDNVKMNLPMASSVTMLAMGLYLWPDTYRHPDLEQSFEATLKWPLDYFLKCWNKETQTLYVQVGDLKEDRLLWERADNDVYAELVDEGKWPFHKATPDKPASDVAAGMASAMMLSTIALSPLAMSAENVDYTLTLYDTAEELYNFAVKYPGVYSDHMPEVDSYFPLYESSGYKDDLCLAAILLYHFTRNETYLNHADSYFEEAVAATEPLSWDNQFPLCALFLYEESLFDDVALEPTTYANYITDFLRHWLDGRFTPAELAYHSEEGTLSYTANAVLVALAAEEMDLISDEELLQRARTFSVRQIGYILGDNPTGKSYVIGHDQFFPVNPFHKNSACPSPDKNCGWGFYNYDLLSNVNQLTGALVGGPDSQDRHRDSRKEKTQNSVAIDYNAGFQSALAGMHILQSKVRDECHGSGSITEYTLSTGPWNTLPWSSVTPHQTHFPLPTTTTTTTSSTQPTPTTKFTTPQPTSVPPQPTTFRYGDALGHSILFYEAQRAGPQPSNYPITWRKPQETNPDMPLQGGWFDDGSKLKTTSAMASSAALLGWGSLTFRNGYQQAGHLTRIHSSLLAPIDYFMEMASDTQIVVKNEDDEGKMRAYWMRAGDNPDEVFHVFSRSIPRVLTNSGGGADILADMATVLAMAGQFDWALGRVRNFKTMATLAAERLYRNATERGDTYNSTDSLYYSGSADASDELCISAAWLYKLTNDSQYLADAKRYEQKEYTKELTWENKHVLCELMLYELTGWPKYRRTVRAFVEHWMGEGVTKTPQGLAWKGDKGPLRHAANAAFVALLAAAQDISPKEFQSWAKSQLDYMLGKNDHAYSYLIGYGDRFPRQPHHRDSSCPDYMEICDWSIYNAPGHNPHTLTGALVSGPDVNDYFEDARTNYTMNRVAIDYNAGFQSALAGLVETYGTVSSSSDIAPPPTTPIRPATKPATKPGAFTGRPTATVTAKKPDSRITTPKKDPRPGERPTATTPVSSKSVAVSCSVTTALALVVLSMFA